MKRALTFRFLVVLLAVSTTAFAERPDELQAPAHPDVIQAP